MLRVLGIESSCDETAAAVVEGAEHGHPHGVVVRSNVVWSQLEVHALYGGVVPELASRAHIRHIQPVIEQALAEAGVRPQQLDAIAVTVAPGLVGALLVGVAAAQGLAVALDKPLVPVHHMEGHLMSPFLMAGVVPAMEFPFVALLVSGGHTLLLHARDFGDYQLLGQTRDDAVGEAFDKGARMLGLGYPGGPEVAALAQSGDRQAVAFPRVLLDRSQFDFSFSGLKTALRTHLLKFPPESGGPSLADVAASYQEAIVDTLVIKSLSACRHVGVSRLVIAGGVGANRRLREKLAKQALKQGVQLYAPPIHLCTDNGAMIASAGVCRLARGDQARGVVNAVPRLPIHELEKIYGR
ncbi:O-sialoglycoprotein endopeptidase [Magnetococcus marinus MC-1]|uniref:tRNA N6-adenosine threonylcarbamoyltransferase n=1 Tax=Magnetococcus marinus (strain ATCC BAA-1437 / JCM 17883 / MC-1) TaxID=156889 RepID=TSAD_MAGMM|nr:tRNA (adenosine(37)-N6)-threonylcarbamoyltransferase complex transferase subunit TsaD [Magnetococcus marinus]A0L5L8.1 RecName: Full=tRNA N6-adenosine threonylcarbamoyltransferase; AltName: Full=N6-L-threonylcarbamoyladenine synthase; Short=t(6)A synthase; AltName: Full=t(6)A37 threonylcarbamoyladenosine biosynthesis protein TsaD; AltName: Full=tRNA threonylcarbamoyladenosine biosynthesis protein TsaD [Magnetococcus marinus MC-1]ABK43261.1 O-sialoglycoprotein endopeptidase [Magnetococcus marinu